MARYTGIFCLTAVVYVLLFSGAAYGEPVSLTVENLIDKHQQFWASIKKIDVSYREIQHEFYTEQVDEKWTAKKRSTIHNYRWVHSEQCGKLFHMPKTSSNETNDNSTEEPLYPSYITSAAQHLVGYIDEEVWNAKPESLRDARKMGCSVTVLASSNSIAGLSMPSMKFLGQKFIPFADGKAPIMLKEVIHKEWLNVLPPVRSVDASGDVLWTLRLENPYWFPSINKDEKVAKQYSLELVFNESKSFYLQRQTRIIPASASPIKISPMGDSVDYKDETVVLEYQQLKDGVYFPKHIAVGDGMPANERSKITGSSFFYSEHYHIDKILVNDEVKENPCYTIPEHFIVYRDDLLRLSAGNDFVPVSIWGRNNEPLVTFTTRKEFNKYMKEVAAYPLPVLGISKTRIALIVIGLIMVFTALIRLYFVREKK